MLATTICAGASVPAPNFALSGCGASFTVAEDL